MTALKAFRYGALVGVAVCVVLYGSFLLFDHMFGEPEILVWPTSILLGAIYGWSISAAILLVLSIVGNAILYGVVAVLLLMLLRLVRRLT